MLGIGTQADAASEDRWQLPRYPDRASSTRLGAIVPAPASDRPSQRSQAYCQRHVSNTTRLQQSSAGSGRKLDKIILADYEQQLSFRRVTALKENIRSTCNGCFPGGAGTGIGSQSSILSVFVRIAPRPTSCRSPRRFHHADSDMFTPMTRHKSPDRPTSSREFAFFCPPGSQADAAQPRLQRDADQRSGLPRRQLLPR